MSVLLFIVGALALMAGVTLAAFGIPINEFSFGNTLIVAGASTAAGGLIVIGLGAVVAQLQRVAEALAVWTPTRSPVADLFEAPGLPQAAPPAGRVPFPPRSKPAAKLEIEPSQDARDTIPPSRGATPGGSVPENLFAGIPSLPNPDVPAVAAEEEVSLSPAWQPPARPEPPPAPARSSYFDTMWPAAAAKAERQPEPTPEPVLPPLSGDTGPEVSPELPPDETAPQPAAEPPFMPEAPASEPPRAVAVLKSGVVDGMGYTLYVDGSIEAELPQGTLRFSSINDLRSYLEKNA